MKNKIIKNNRGSSLVELLAYIFLLSIIVLVLTQTIVAMISSYRNIKIVRLIENSAMLSMERITREIRNAVSVDVGNSILGLSPGKLTLNSNDSAGTVKTVEFYLENLLIKVEENNVYQGPLSNQNTSVTSLIFDHMQSGESESVRVQMQIQATSSGRVITHNFYDTVILRGSY